MYFLQYTISQDDEDRRLDRVLRKFLKNDLSLSLIYKYLRNGEIKVNKKKSKPDYRTKKNDIIFINEKLISGENFSKSNESFSEKSQKQKEIEKISQEIQVLFENQYVKIINKPYNIPVQKAKKEEIALDEIIKFQHQPKEKSLSFLPGPLHRLDKKTTGVLVFSNNLVGAKVFSEIMQNQHVTKTYIAILEGKLSEKKRFEDSISKKENSKNNKFNTVSVNSKAENSKTAITEVIPIKSGIYKNKEITLAKIKIFTGRTHQIRSQCAFHGFPLLGDTAYNKKTEKISKDVDFFLHAYSLTFPENNEIQLPTTIIAALPKNFLKFLKNYLSLEDFVL